MVLLHHTESQKIRKNLIILGLLVSAVRFAWSDPFPAPQILSAAGQCPETVISWTSSGQVPYYVLILFGPDEVITQAVMGTQVSFFNLTPGDYSVMVKAGSLDGNDSDYSPIFTFTIHSCIQCAVPTVQINSANPSTLWPPNGRLVPVSFAGTVNGITATCPLTRADYSLTDSQGGPLSGGVQVMNDGSFVVNLSLAARRSGDDASGRVYTLLVNVANQVGAATSAPVMVNVPHDQGH